MGFTLFICGPEVEALSSAIPALVEALAERGVRARLLPNGRGAAEDESGIVLLSEPRLAVREAMVAGREVVLVDWPGAGPYEYSTPPHGRVTEGADVLDGLAEVLAVLEGLGYVPLRAGEARDGDQEAELVRRLKELGYV